MGLLLHLVLFITSQFLFAQSVTLTYRPSTCPVDNSTCQVMSRIKTCHTLNITCKELHSDFQCESFENCGINSSFLDRFLDNAGCNFTKGNQNLVLSCKTNMVKKECTNPHECGLTTNSPLIDRDDVRCHITHNENQCILPSILDGTDFSNYSLSCTDDAGMSDVNGNGEKQSRNSDNKASLDDVEHKDNKTYSDCSEFKGKIEQMFHILTVLVIVTLVLLIALIIWLCTRTNSCCCRSYNTDLPSTPNPVRPANRRVYAEAREDDQELQRLPINQR